MAGNLIDLRDFWKRVIACDPWQYDHTVSIFHFHRTFDISFISFSVSPLPWKEVNLRDDGRKLNWGIVWEDW